MIRGSQTKTALAAMMEGEPGDLDELVKAMRMDYAVTLSERTFRTTAKQAKVTITPVDSTSSRANVVAKQLQKLYWKKLAAMMEMVSYGRVAWEKVWGWDGVNVLNTLDLKELPYTKTEMRLTDDGQFDGVRLKPAKKDDKPIDLSPEYSWWLALDPTPLNPHGQSRYTGAPEKLWKDRRETFRLLKVFIKKFVLGAGIVHGPDVIDDPARDGEKITGADAIEPHYNELASGGFLFVSNKRTQNSDGSTGEYEWDVEKLELEVRDGRPLLDIIAASDAWMLLAFGFPPKTILEGDSVGSFALVSMQMLLLWSVADEIVDQIVSSYQEYVVDKVAAQNGVGKIEVNYTPLTERPDDIANELLKSWLTTPQLSPLVSSVDLESIFDAVGIQVSAEGVARLKRIQAGLASIPATPDQVRAREPAALPVEMESPFLRRLWR